MTNPTTRTVLWMSLLSLIAALQVLIIAGMVSSWIPQGLSAYEHTLFAQSQATIKPEREILLFRIWVVAAIGVQTALMVLFRRRLGQPSLDRALRRFITVDGAFVLIQVFAAFKIFLYGAPVWARAMLYGALALNILAKVFWVELRRGWSLFSQLRPGSPWLGLMSRAAGAAGFAFIVLCLYMPHGERALMLVQQVGVTVDFDRYVAAPLLSWMTVPSYAWAVNTLQWSVLLYWCLLYFFFRRLLGSWALAFCAVVWGIKFNMFHAGMAPVFLSHPQDSVWGTWGDVAMLYLLYRHTQGGGRVFLWWLAFTAGMMPVALSVHGMYILAAFWMYLLVALAAAPLRRALFRFPRDVAALKACVYLPFLLMGLGFWLTHRDVGQEMMLLLGGNNARSVYTCLAGRRFFAFILAFVLPLFYLWNAAWAVARRDLMLLFLAVYALCLNHAFVVHSTTSNYYVAAVPLVAMMGLHFRQALSWLEAGHMSACKAVLAITAAGALLTNTMFTYYPNALNVARVNWAGQARPWQESPPIKDDAAMIARLTPAGGAVPVISRYEVALLMAARRKSFFPFTPLVQGEAGLPAGMDTTALYTQQRLAAVTALLDKVQPARLFIDPVLYEQGEGPFMDYVRARYVLEERGATVWGLKRL